MSKTVVNIAFRFMGGVEPTCRAAFGSYVLVQNFIQINIKRHAKYF